jgi:hypothetical protein
MSDPHMALGKYLIKIGSSGRKLSCVRYGSKSDFLPGS